MTTVSIVIPTYNQSKFIGRTLNSIVSQDYPIEIIVIDGGSDDGTIDVIKSYENSLAYWISEPDRGQTHAINKGMQKATGELRAYINSDDVYLPGAVKVIVDAYQKNPDADLVHGRCVTIDEDDQRLSRQFFSDIESNADILDLWRVWFEGRNFVQPEVFWTRRLADRIGAFDETRHFAMDYDYWVRSILSGAKVCHVDHEVAAFRIWAAQKSSAANDAADELRDIAIKQIKNGQVKISPFLRFRLISDWVFDEIYAKKGLEYRELPPFSRRIAMLSLALRHPELVFSAGFRSHTFRAAKSWIGWAA